ncbi:LytTR family DNA-binding domain-containing protein [Chitinophaga pendula]|uniref:LytR/AlgR family response regulator transcription factor n=1 Tax=Chitinophaga TaxID=79328 RepID=UPI000BAF2F27|nr:MULTISPECIES: LytTR family DNA-binding domain-containing protein [Chitinophaga]ASZ15069.1 DNA-binding response regulator [Chitinophaga sp. MD30]ASZ15073.1 DNA-binding response regulator [Chitinophaga sp. MD30]UCJ08841.1 LytTR family DNA-binding domain-containing protein [Chitinophaga pendula]
MSKLTCLIVDDEPGAHYVLEAHIAKVQALTLAGNCYNALEAANFLHGKQVDILLLDINMPELSGLDLLKTLINKPQVILTTAYSEFALESYEYDVVDFLLKPISFPRFLKAVNKIILSDKPSANNAATTLSLKTGNSRTTVSLDEICYVQSMGNYVKVFTGEKCLIVNATTAEMEKQLPPERFIRIHKSYIVAADKVNAVFARHIELDGTELPVGQTFKMNLGKLKER